MFSWFVKINVHYIFIFTAYDVTVISLNPEEIGQLLIIDCSSTSDIPSTENQIVGDPLILRCNLNTSISFDSIHFTWSSNNVTLRNVTYPNQFRLQDHYVIPQLNTSNHGQEYKCDAMINTILPGAIPPGAIPPVANVPVAESGAIVLDLTGKIVSIYAGSYMYVCIKSLKVHENMYSCIDCIYYIDVVCILMMERGQQNLKKQTNLDST